jgi:SAM-dependent methyltransferase
VVVSERRDSAGPVSGEVADREAVIWHELECGGYRADLPLWRELAAASAASARAGAAGAPGAPILDVGAGSGRVTLELARAGHEVTALDLDARLLGALAGRVGSLPVQTVHADARDFQLERRDYALCIAPMQTVQLLGGADGRMAFLRCARTHLRPGGLLACAILTELEPFDCTNGGPAPTPERARVDGMLYVSQALRVQLTRRAVVIERERTVSRGTSTREPERDVIELDRVTATRLRREGREAGLTPIPTRSISATDRHVGSAVVMLSA